MNYHTNRFAFQRSPVTFTTTFSSIQTPFPVQNNKVHNGRKDNEYTTMLSGNNNEYNTEVYDNDSISYFVETDESISNEVNDSENDKTSDNQAKIIIIALLIVIICIFSITLAKLKNRTNDNNPIQERSVYDQNKPLPHISPSLLNKQNQSYQQMPSLQVQNSMVINMDYNNFMIPNQNVMEYDTQNQYVYEDNRISFLALGDSAIEPRQKSLTLKEEIIKKSKDNVPIPLIHINNKNGPNRENENERRDNEEDDINLKAVEPLPDTIIPSKNVPQRFSNNRFLNESHDLFKKMSRGVKNVGNHLKPNSIMSTISSSSKSSNGNTSVISNNNNNKSNHYSILSSPKE